jgi:DHA2 family multidrug resistance protein-like MFS transporter
VLGLSPLRAGLWTVLPFGAFIVGSMLAPPIVRRVRPAFVVGAGPVLAAVGLGMLTQVDGASGLAPLVTGSVVFSLGLAPVFTLATDLIVGSAPPERAGAASAISETGSEFGGALGIAVLGSIGTAVYRDQVATSVPARIPPEAAREAFVHGLQVTAIISAVIAMSLAILVTVLLRHVRTGSESETQPGLDQRIGGDAIMPEP